jgi:hypothetical protein
VTRQRLARVLASVLGVFALAVCLLCSARRAHAGGENPSAKKPVSGQTAPVADTQSAPPVNVVPAVVAPGTLVPSSSGRAAEPAPESDGTAAAKLELTSLPVDGGLPVMVNIGVFVIELRSFDDVKGEFEATTDLRLRWKDPRLRFRGTGLSGKYKEYRGKEAEERIEQLWSPNVDVPNRLEVSGYVGHRLRVFPDGQIETIVRSTGRYKTDVDVQNFPFDMQALKQTMVVRDQTTDQVMLKFDKEDERFSRAAADVRLESWGIGDVDLDSDLVSGWNGDRYSRVSASLHVRRSTSTGLTTIFIPLLASLLIPLLTLWMNRATREGFEVDAVELANMAIGGLFSVIALSYAVSSAYSTIAGSDNTVTRLFALNYATLALSLGIVVFLYRGNLVRRWFGPYVHEQVFRFVLWAVPLLTLATSVAFVLAAAC